MGEPPISKDLTKPLFWLAVARNVLQTNSEMAHNTGDVKAGGYNKRCRECEAMIYLHRGTNGPWRAYDPPVGRPEDHDWARHRCAAALQDAELLGIVAPPGSKPADLIPRLKRMISDLQEVLGQMESRQEAAQAAAQAAKL